MEKNTCAIFLNLSLTFHSKYLRKIKVEVNDKAKIRNLYMYVLKPIYDRYYSAKKRQISSSILCDTHIFIMRIRVCVCVVEIIVLA